MKKSINFKFLIYKLLILIFINTILPFTNDIYLKDQNFYIENIEIQKLEDCKAFTNSDFVPYTINTAVGPLIIDNLLLHEIIISEASERMKYIDQGGPCAYWEKEPHYFRSSHCLGVASLIQQHGGSRLEVIVAMIHDFSHTVFSHLADRFFLKRFDTEYSYQDNIHIWYLSKTDIYNICKKYSININKFDPDLGCYFMLEQKLPDMCADRIEYNIETAKIWNRLSNDEINYILNHLKYENKKWFFDDIYAAQIFAELPLFFMDNIWNNPTKSVFHIFFSEALGRLLEINLIKLEDIYFGKDCEILDKINKSNDPQIKYILECCNNIDSVFTFTTENDYTFFMKHKFRGIDPLIRINNNFVRLSEIDENFKKKYDSFKEKTQKGYYIKLLKPLKINNNTNNIIIN
jgi:HD superfamily phosphohydrolase